MKPIIQAGNDEQADEEQTRQALDELLRLLAFRDWPDLDAAGQQFWIVLEQIRRDEQSTDQEDGQIDPSLPEAQRSGRYKKRRSQGQHQEGKAQDRFHNQAAHVIPFSAAQFDLSAERPKLICRGGVRNLTQEKP